MSQSSQESQDSDIISDSPLKHPRNGSGESPIAKKKKVKKPKRLGKETVKQDTSQVMRSYLLRCKSVTEDDLEEDLETDAGPEDESPDEAAAAQHQKEVIDNIAHRLQEMGDEMDNKYKDKSPDSGDLNAFLKEIAKQSVYASFKKTLKDFCCNVEQYSNPDLNSLAFVFFLTRRFTQMAREAGRRVDDFVHFGQRFINEEYGEWIEEQGGWGRVLGDGTEV